MFLCFFFQQGTPNVWMGGWMDGWIVGEVLEGMEWRRSIEPAYVNICVCVCLFVRVGWTEMNDKCWWGVGEKILDPGIFVQNLFCWPTNIICIRCIGSTYWLRIGVFHSFFFKVVGNEVICKKRLIFFASFRNPKFVSELLRKLFFPNFCRKSCKKKFFH